jgi:hypothetical protein
VLAQRNNPVTTTRRQSTRLLRTILAVIVALLALEPLSACAAPIDFERDVWTILQVRCIQCHGPEKQKSSLRVDSRAALLKGGDSGPAVVAGDPAKSYLLELVAAADGDLRMPPEGERLTGEQIATLRQWILEGATWPAGFLEPVSEAKHWAFQPVTRPAVPEHKDTGLASRNPIDAFVAAKLAERGLQMSPAADPRTLIRRVTLDLTGLQPTLAEVEDFVSACTLAGRDGESDPYDALVNRLLASPRYGERWAQHWLDVIRYADTTGYEMNAIRPSAWPYRDYVIAALNADIPYPQFILEQLAGDRLGVDAATGFLVTAPLPSRIEIGQEAAAIAQAYYNGLDEVLQNIGSALLGMTVGCARCHDHKFDPVSTRDYYSLAANFAGLQFVDRPWPSGNLLAQEKEAVKRRLAEIRKQLGEFSTWREIEPIRSTDVFHPVRAKWIRLAVTDTFTGKGYAAAIDEIEVWAPGAKGEPPRNVGSTVEGAVARSSGADVALGGQDRFLNDGQVGRQSRWTARNRTDEGDTWVEIELPRPMVIHRVAWSCDYDDQGTDLVAAQWRTLRQWHIEVAEEPGQWRTVVPPDRRNGMAGTDFERRTSLEKQFAQGAIRQWELEHIFAGRFRSPEPSYVLRRGDPLQPLNPVPPGGIDVLGRYELALDEPEAERRVALAKWLGSDRHPLTARVLVNRVWRHHFGAGLVDTPSDFGTQGERPTHPELLDWLASEFMARGWRLKELHKLICTSAAYRESSQPNATAARIDADARLLWRYPPRRLEADAIRDSMLFASGSLDLTMGGPGVNIYKLRPKPNAGAWLPKEEPGRETWRRTIYLLRVRGADDGVFKPFDVPDCGQVRAKRGASTTPLQALNLFNSPFIIDQAERLAARAERDAGEDIGKQIEHVFALTLARVPTDQERAACSEVAKEHGLASVCRALFNSNEFLFVE